MRIVAAVLADFSETGLGRPARLTASVGGLPVLIHTLGQALRIRGVEALALVVQPRDADAAAALLHRHGLSDRIELAAVDDGLRPRRRLIAAARKWNSDGWRGTPLGTTWFDEYVEPGLALRVLERYQADGALLLEGHMALLDDERAARMVQHQLDAAGTARFVFTQSPPGIAGILLRVEPARELAQASLTVGALLTYRPQMPQMDPISREPCLQTPAETQIAQRFCLDQDCLLECITGLSATPTLPDSLPPDADEWAALRAAWRRALAADRPRARRLPIEIELELTTRDPLPETTLRPRGPRVPSRELDDLDAVRRVAAELGALDDRRVVLGGHGDPLLHPQFPAICQVFRAADVHAVAVRTSLVEMSDSSLETLIAQRVDIVEVLLDADSPATYARVHGRDAFDAVLRNMQRIEQMRRDRRSPEPIVLPSLTRCAATAAELESFYDRWLRATGGAVLHGYNRYCGVLPADTLLDATPLVRGACRRLAARLSLLADGAAVLCGQDLDGRTKLGDWRRQSLAEIWRGERLRSVQAQHASLDGARGPASLARLPALCQRCDEWFRP